MKTYIIYILLCSLIFTFQACEKDYSKSSSKHVYGPTDPIPLNQNPDALVRASYDLYAGDTEPTTFSILPYADLIQEQLDMSIDELITAIGAGTVRVAPVNPNRNLWIRTPGNAGDKYSWYLNNSGGLSEADDEYLFATISFDPVAKEFSFVLDENAGGTVPLYIGFASESDYDTHVLFIFTITAFDMSFVTADITIPAGDYSAYELKFADIAENIQFAFDMTPEQFNTAIDTEAGGTLKLYMIDHDTKLFVWDGESTANNGGYWVNSSNEICTWGAEGFSYFIEPWTGDDMSFAIGRAPGLASGTQFEIKFGISNSDRTKSMILYITATLE